MSIKALVTGDLHLGRRSATVHATAEESSTRFTWQKIVNWCIAQPVDILVLTGDIVDRENRFFEAIGALKRGFDQLDKAGIPVYMIAGNHDFDTLLDVVKSASFSNVHLLGAGGNWEMKTYEKAGEKIQFVGWSFPKENVQFDPLHNYANIQLDPNFPAVGLLHGDVGNMESNYSRTDFPNLLNKGMDAWLLGHIHKSGKLHDSEPLIFYPGSPHALSSKEQGPHGAVLLEISAKDDMHATDIVFSPVRYEQLEIDITGVADKSAFRTKIISSLTDDAHARIAEFEGVTFLIYNIQITGFNNKKVELEAWKNEVIEQIDLGLQNGGTILVRSINISVEPLIENMEELAKANSPIGILASAILSIQKAEPNPIVDELIRKMKQSIKDMNAAPVYQLLYREQKQEQPTDDVCKEYVLKECKSLLSNLLIQTQ